MLSSTYQTLEARQLRQGPTYREVQQTDILFDQGSRVIFDNSLPTQTLPFYAGDTIIVS